MEERIVCLQSFSGKLVGFLNIIVKNNSSKLTLKPSLEQHDGSQHSWKWESLHSRLQSLQNRYSWQGAHHATVRSSVISATLTEVPVTRSLPFTYYHCPTHGRTASDTLLNQNWSWRCIFTGMSRQCQAWKSFTALAPAKRRMPRLAMSASFTYKRSMHVVVMASTSHKL
jgi:hypothetical protein